MLLNLSFVLLLLFSCGYAIVVGGPTARQATLAMVIAYVATALVTLDQSARWSLQCIDVVLLIVLARLSLGSKHFWPIWVAGLQAAAVASNFALVASPPVAFPIFRAIVGFWAIPILAAMPIGIWLDRRGVRRAATDRP